MRAPSGRDSGESTGCRNGRAVTTVAGLAAQPGPGRNPHRYRIIMTTGPPDGSTPPSIPAEIPAGAWRRAAPAVAMVAWGGNHFSPLLLMYRQIDGYSAVQVNLFFAFY